MYHNSKDMKQDQKDEYRHIVATDAFSGIVNIIVDGVITIDGSGTILSFNPACERFFGYFEKEIVGQNVKMLMPSSYQKEHDGYLENYARSGQRKIIGIGREVVGRRMDGTTFPMELSVGEVDSGNAKTYVGVIRDVTDRKRLEQGLTDSEAMHRAIIETAVDGIIIIDTLGTVRMFNPASEKMFGYVSSEVVGTNVKMLMPSPYYDEHDKYLHNYKVTGEKKIIGLGRQIFGRRKDGTTFPIELSVGETNVGNGRLYVGVLRDVTHSHADAEALRRSEADMQEYIRELEETRDILVKQKTEMERLAEETNVAQEVAMLANRTKSEFVAMMSHEIRTPMNAIIGFADLLSELELSETALHHVNIIKQSGSALMSILDDILDLSKIEAGHLEIEHVAINLTEKLNFVREVWSSNAETKGLYLKTEISPGTPKGIFSDPIRLRQVLFNLVNNAIKFTHTGGVIVRLSAPFVTEDEICLRFDVEDTGIGIPQDTHEKIFDAFAQADASTTRQFGGTGLGLSICRRLVSLMDGEIGLESTEGVGSTFWFTVRGKPLQSVPGSSQNENSINSIATQLPTSMHCNKFVLVAEDNKYNQILVRKLLESIGCRVDIANNGEEAVQAVEQNTYDVVLMDINMPVMDGLAALKSIRALPSKNAQIPVIALTANAMKGDREKLLSAGMNDYIEKPINSRRLIQSVLEVHPTLVNTD